MRGTKEQHAHFSIWGRKQLLMALIVIHMITAWKFSSVKMPNLTPINKSTLLGCFYTAELSFVPNEERTLHPGSFYCEASPNVSWKALNFSERTCCHHWCSFSGNQSPVVTYCQYITATETSVFLMQCCDEAVPSAPSAKTPYGHIHWSVSEYTHSELSEFFSLYHLCSHSTSLSLSIVILSWNILHGRSLKLLRWHSKL